MVEEIVRNVIMEEQPESSSVVVEFMTIFILLLKKINIMLASII